MSTQSILERLPRPAIIAHRGANAHAPENTLPAFELAVHHQADAIEMDVKLTADGEVVVFHDQTLDRIVGRPGKIADFSLAEIRKFDVGSHYDLAFHGVTIPTLNEVFAEIGPALIYNIDLTDYTSINESLPKKTVEIIEAYHLTEHVLLSSFNPIALIHARRANPDIPIALLSQPGMNGAWARSRLGRLLKYQALHVAVTDINPKTIEMVHEAKLRLHTYTVNDPIELLRLFNIGVDGVFTDDPALARQTLSRYRK